MIGCGEQPWSGGWRYKVQLVSERGVQVTSPPIITERTGGRPVVAKLWLVLLDTVVVAGAMLLAQRTRGALRGVDHPFHGRAHLLVGVISLPLWIAAFRHYGLYTARLVATRIDEAGRLLHATFAGIVLTLGLGAFAGHYEPRSWLALTFTFAVVGITLEREAVRRIFWHRRTRGRHLRRVLIVGTNAEAADLYAQLSTERGLGYEVVGFLSDAAPRGTEVFAGKPVLGAPHEAIELVRAVDADGVVVAMSALDRAASNRLVRRLVGEGVHVDITCALQDIAAERLTVRAVGRLAVMYVEPARHGGWRGAAKRAFDLVGSVVITLLTLPVIIATVIAIKLDTGGPVFFKQVRVGREGNTFKVWKFRTMVTEAEALILDLRDRNEADGPLFKMKDDPRVTRVGKLLRRLSIDEIPQVWNVLRGEMSLVGPRPALPLEMASWAPETHDRLRVKPGLTGMWQVSGRSNCSFAEYTRLDLYYVDNWTLWSDLAILAKTVPTLLLRRGAY